jgi:hypothetical protein
MKNKNYIVRFKVTQLFEVEVSAKSEELAKIKAEKMFDKNKDEYFSDSETEVSIEEIKGEVV